MLSPMKPRGREKQRRNEKKSVACGKETVKTFLLFLIFRVMHYICLLAAKSDANIGSVDNIIETSVAGT